MTHWLTEGHSEIDLRETMHRCGFRKPGLYRITKEGHGHGRTFYRATANPIGPRFFQQNDLLFFLRAEYLSSTDSHIILVFLDSFGELCIRHTGFSFDTEKHLLVKSYFEPVTE